MNMKRDLTNVKGYIYKMVSPNNQIYIGQTINIKSRMYSYNKNKFKKQTKLWNNCRFYNWNPSEAFEIIEECLCGEDKILLNGREIYWINFYDSYLNGLNCTKGGKGQVGRRWTEEEKLKQREITLTNGSGFIKGNRINEGKILSEENKVKITLSSK